jgi:hypothetical protein
MPSSSDVFILSAVRGDKPAAALQQAIQESGVNPAKVQDLLFGCDDAGSVDARALAIQAGLKCPALTLPSSLRALFFAAQSILCEDVELVLVGGLENGECAALLLGSPRAVGVYNLLPLARVDARSLDGVEAALAKAEITPEDVVGLTLKGSSGALLAVELVAALAESEARWGMLMVDEAVMLAERV